MRWQRMTKQRLNGQGVAGHGMAGQCMAGHCMTSDALDGCHVDGSERTLSRRIQRSISTFLNEEDGPTAVEYAVMLSLIMIACIGSFVALSNATRDSFDTTAQKISDAVN
jgi:pilus assembly protein Flp/PilA